MKTLKILISLLALAAVPFVQAQASKSPSAEGRKGGGAGGVDAQVERIDAAVTLTADQKTKVRAVLAGVQEKVQALPQEERRSKGAELRQAANKEVRALLTPEQQTKFDAMPPAPKGGGDKGKKKNQ